MFVGTKTRREAGGPDCIGTLGAALFKEQFLSLAILGITANRSKRRAARLPEAHQRVRHLIEREPRRPREDTQSYHMAVGSRNARSMLQWRSYLTCPTALSVHSLLEAGSKPVRHAPQRIGGEPLYRKTVTKSRALHVPRTQRSSALHCSYKDVTRGRLSVSARSAGSRTECDAPTPLHGTESERDRCAAPHGK